MVRPAPLLSLVVFLSLLIFSRALLSGTYASVTLSNVSLTYSTSQLAFTATSLSVQFANSSVALLHQTGYLNHASSFSITYAAEIGVAAPQWISFAKLSCTGDALPCSAAADVFIGDFLPLFNIGAPSGSSSMVIADNFGGFRDPPLLTCASSCGDLSGMFPGMIQANYTGFTVRSYSSIVTRLWSCPDVCM